MSSCADGREVWRFLVLTTTVILAICSLSLSLSLSLTDRWVNVRRNQSGLSVAPREKRASTKADERREQEL